MTRNIEIVKFKAVNKVLILSKYAYQKHLTKECRGITIEACDPDIFNCANAYDYFNMCIFALEMEGKYRDEFKACGKELLEHVEVPTLDTIEQILSYYFEIYNPEHQIRYVIETMDSITSVKNDILENKK